MRFIAYDLALDLLRALVPLFPKLVAQDRELEDQLRRAGRNIHLNIKEANKRKGADRANRFGWAVSEANEVTGALEIAVVFGYLEQATVEPAMELADRVRAVCYRLQHPR
jgi:four helix bundle protein